MFFTPAGIPVLVAPAGTPLTLTLDQPVDGVTASVAGIRNLATTRTSDRTFTTTVPSDASMPFTFGVHADYSTPDVTGNASYVVTLSPAAPSAANLRLRGSRLDVDVICPVGCKGFLTLKTDKLRVARFEVTGQGTLTGKVRAAARRHIKRHGLKELRAGLTTTGRAPVASALKIGG